MNALPSTWGESLTHGLLAEQARRHRDMEARFVPSKAGRSLPARFDSVCRSTLRAAGTTLVTHFESGEKKRRILWTCECYPFSLGYMLSLDWRPIRALMGRTHAISGRPLGVVSNHAATRIAGAFKVTTGGEIGRVALPHALMLYVRGAPVEKQRAYTANDVGLACWNRGAGGEWVMVTFIGLESLDRLESRWRQMRKVQPVTINLDDMERECRNFALEFLDAYPELFR